MTPDTHAVQYRRATAADAEPLARGVVDGVADYPAFAPAGWRAPSVADEAEHLRQWLAHDEVRCVVAEDADGVAGQVTVLPAARAPHPVADPALGHVSNLFVRRDRWGTGIARDLLAGAVEAARERGFTELRLFVAAGQARARRFYEREGWRPAGGPFDDPAAGLTMLEYRRALGGR